MSERSDVIKLVAKDKFMNLKTYYMRKYIVFGGAV